MSSSWHTTGPHEYHAQQGTKARGHTYERRVGKELAVLALSRKWTFRNHEWVRAAQGNSIQWFQPDFLLETPEHRLLFEVKLTYQQGAFDQMAEYISILPRGLHVVPVQICRNLTPHAPEPVTCFEDIYPGCVWHWLL